MTVVAVAIALLAAVLFYRWGSPAHKRFAGKAVLATLAVAFLGLAVMVGISQDGDRRNREVQQSVAVRFVSGEPLSEEELRARARAAAREARDRGATREQIESIVARIMGGSAVGDLTGPVLSAVTFELCNRGRSAVAQVSFYPRTFNRGYSTAYPLAEQATYISARENTFESDRILAAGTCERVTYWSRFIARDSIHVELGHVTLLR
jgi:hypothetical protein